MKNIAILTCFTYTNATDYKTFLDDDIKSDLRRLLPFCSNKIGCSMENIYILTDIIPNQNIQQNIINNYVNNVIKYFNSRGIKEIPTHDISTKPSHWCYNIAKKYAPVLNTNLKQLLMEIHNSMSHDLRNNNIIEFGSCFNTFIYVNSKEQYCNQLINILQKVESGDNVFYYFSGHGSYKNGISLVIPTRSPTSQFLQGTEFDYILEKYIKQGTRSIFILDCCHSSEIISLQFRVPSGIKSKVERTAKKYSGKDIMVVSSTIGDESCGFYESEPRGSLFTHYFLEACNKKIPITFNDIFVKVQNNINNYRSKNKQLKQTITIQSNNRKILENNIFPFW